jgi:DNA-directed RNA polymerase subunit RPC12/RpoP
MATETGKRYRCPDCGAEFIVTRGGDGQLRCGDKPLEQV